MREILIKIHKNDMQFCVINVNKIIFASLLRNYDVIKPWENLPHIGKKLPIFIEKLHTKDVNKYKIKLNS